MNKLLDLHRSAVKHPPTHQKGGSVKRKGNLKKNKHISLSKPDFSRQTVHRLSANLSARCKAVTEKRGLLGKWGINRSNSSAEIGRVRQGVIDEEKGILILDYDCVIQHCNRKGSELFGMNPNSLIGQPVSSVLPHLAEKSLIINEQINPRLRFLSRIGHQFEAVGHDGAHFKCGLIFNHKTYQEKDYIQLIICPIQVDAERLQ